MAEYHGVLICGELGETRLTSISKELLGIGRKLADDLEEELSILLMGSNLSDATKEAIAYGADKVYIADEAVLDNYHCDTYTETATNLCKEISPSIFLLGQTDIGRDIAPRIAARLKVSLAVDCVGLRIEPDTKLLVQTRPVYGGNALAEMVSLTWPQMTTVRAKSMSPLEPNESRQGEIISVKTKIDAGLMKIKSIEKVKQQVEGVRLEDAEVVVAGGAGIGSAENFAMLEELARLLNGAIGASRVPCQEGWVPQSVEIGQTGKIITPALYIAIGISGAVQHIAGCLGSKCIVAVNKDPDANILKVADFGIIADYKEALPAFIGKCKELIGR